MEDTVPFELTAKTPAGARLVALAETLADEIGARAAEHDRDGSYPFESFASVKRSGYFTAPIPEHLGGLGVTSAHDVLVASTRLARGDASLTLGVNMHFAYLQNVVRRWHAAEASGNERRAAAIADSLRQIAADGVVFASAVSETGQDLTHPATTATRTEDGWIVSGRKVFSTMSAAADVLYTSVTFAGDDGGERYGYAMVPRTTPGVVIHNDWDALGMRASGSHTVSFEDVRLPSAALRGGFRVGDSTAYIERNLDAGLFHAAASLGVAETANTHVTSRLARSDSEPDARTRMLSAENVVDLSACRAVLSSAASLIDDHFAAHAPSQGSAEDITRLFAEAQAAKTFIGEAAVRIVDRALSLSGGAGYLNGSPLARAYRDVRAGAFMHPLGANRAYELLGQLALGREPSLH
jgi:alkylation response protein AidB-like acyl-CoA dehydrogenase